MKTFDKLCEENYERIYKYIWCMLNNKSQTDDIAQEVFLIAYEKGFSFLNHEKPEAFLYKTAKNLIYEYIRKQKKENIVEFDENLEIPMEKDIYETICMENDKAVVEDTYVDFILNQLSQKEYQLYQDYYIEHKSMKLIAKEHKTSEVATRMKYVRLRREVARIVKALKLGEI